MNLISFGKSSRQIARTVLVLKKNSPHLFFAGGLIGSVASTVLACKATLKLESTMDEIQEDIKAVKLRKEHPSLAVVGREYTERDYIQDLMFVYGRTVKKMAKLYGPAVLLNVASTGALTGSHVQLARRNSALTATAATLAKAYDEYRARVREEIGEDKELELHQALVQTQLSIDGKKQNLLVAGDPETWPPFSRVFDETSSQWQKDAELNNVYIKAQEIYHNHLLQARGHVFLNEVYDALGLERSKEGAVVGWVLNKPNEPTSYISFGLDSPVNARFVDHMERNALLDFNVDGIIYDKI